MDRVSTMNALDRMPGISMGSGQTSDEQHKEAKRMAIEALKAETRQHHLGKHADITVIDEVATHDKRKETHECVSETHGGRISRQAAVESMANAIWHYPNDLYKNLNSYEMAKGLAEDGLMFLPSAEPVHGEWVQISPARIYECSKCGQNVMTDDIEAYKFCHGCGAKMVSKESPETLSLKESGDAVSKGGETNGDTD